MFKIFKKKTNEQKLEEKYEKLLEESFQLSKTNRRLSDTKQAEAEEVLKELEVTRSRKEL